MRLLLKVVEASFLDEEWTEHRLLFQQRLELLLFFLKSRFP